MSALLRAARRWPYIYEETGVRRGGLAVIYYPNGGGRAATYDYDLVYDFNETQERISLPSFVLMSKI